MRVCCSPGLPVAFNSILQAICSWPLLMTGVECRFCPNLTILDTPGMQPVAFSVAVPQSVSAAVLLMSRYGIACRAAAGCCALRL